MKYFFHAPLFIVLLCWSCIAVLHAQPSCPSINTVQITPDKPSENEPITLTANGDWCTNVMQVQTGQILGKKSLIVQVNVTGGLLQVLSPWDVQVPLLPLQHGKYEVQVQLRDASTGQVLAEHSLTLGVKKGKGKD